MAPAAKIPPMIRTWRRVKTLGSAMIRDSVPAYGLRLPPSADQYRAREGRDGHADHGRLRGHARADQRPGRARPDAACRDVQADLRGARGGGRLMAVAETEKLIGEAPPSPAGPLDSADAAGLPEPPVIPLPRSVQVLRFNQRQIEFVFK